MKKASFIWLFPFIDCAWWHISQQEYGQMSPGQMSHIWIDHFVSNMNIKLGIDSLFYKGLWWLKTNVEIFYQVIVDFLELPIIRYWVVDRWINMKKTWESPQPWKWCFRKISDTVLFVSLVKPDYNLYYYHHIYDYSYHYDYHYYPNYYKILPIRYYW